MPEVIKVKVVEDKPAAQPVQQPQAQPEAPPPSEEQAYLAKLQQRVEKSKPDQLFTSFLQDRGLRVKKPKIKGVSFIAGNGKNTYAFVFTNSNKEAVEFKLDNLEPITEFHASFGFLPLVAVFWRHRKMPLWKIMSLNDGELRLYTIKDLQHDLKQKLAVAHKAKGISAQAFGWK
jgi:Holliday junction resolvase